MLGILAALRFEIFTLCANYKCLAILFQRQILHVHNITRSVISLLGH